MDKKHLTIDGRMLFYSGIGTYLKNIIPYLIDYFDVTILVYDRDKSAHLLGDKIQYTKVNSSIYSVWEHFELLFVAKKCDIFWSPHYNSPLLPVFCKKRVVTIHDVNHLALGHTYSIYKRIYAYFLISNSLLRSDLVLTVSHFTKSEIYKYFPWYSKNRIEVTSLGANHLKSINNHFSSNINKTNNFSFSYILYVGNVKPHKNLSVVIDILPRLLFENPDIRLVVVGKKEGFVTGDDGLLNKIESNHFLKSHVVFTGFVDDDQLVGLYANALLFVFPSLYEGFGLPPLEAMSAGCPVICSNRASLPEVCGDAVLYFDPDQPEELLSAISRLLNDVELKTNLLDRARERLAKFDWKITGEQIKRLFLLLAS